MPAAIGFQESRMPGNPLVRFDEGRVGRTARCRPLSYSTALARNLSFSAIFVLCQSRIMSFRLAVTYQPCGDQENAIAELTRGVREGEQHQVLLGVTGSGKTFTMAKVIEAVNRPALILAHNKTLAAQLYHEFKTFFPTPPWSTSSATTIITSPK